MREVLKLIETKRTLNDVGRSAHRRFGDTSYPIKLSGLGWNIEKVWTHVIDE